MLRSNLIHNYSIFQAITADLARTKFQITGGGPDPVKGWHLIQTAKLEEGDQVGGS